MKKTKYQKVLKLEQSAFTKNKQTFCKRILGKMKTNDGSDFSIVHCGGTLMYNYKSNRFTLLIPTKKQLNNTIDEPKHEFIGVDPGVRTFLTGVSKDHSLEIGLGLSNRINKILKVIDKIHKSKLTKSRKRKAEDKRYVKISNLIDDLQWKSIEYLTDNYKTILIGNMSTKSIVKNGQSNKLNKMTKRIALLMKLYVYRGRLKYKCFLKNCKYKMINERYTTQICSFCGYVKKDIGSNKIYNCNKCQVTIDRDLNSARNIQLLGIK